MQNLGVPNANPCTNFNVKSDLRLVSHAYHISSKITSEKASEVLKQLIHSQVIVFSFKAETTNFCKQNDQSKTDYLNNHFNTYLLSKF